MAKGYNLKEWVDGFEKDGRKFDFTTDALDSSSTVLFPGRFYILKYKAQTDKPYNSRPVIISLGLSKKDPESFLCIDLCLIPRIIRMQFVQTVFDLFWTQISDNMNRFWDTADADKQGMLKQFSYDMIEKNPLLKPFRHAVKRYKIANTFKIYSIPFSGVYKIVGELPDTNCFINSDVRMEQTRFFNKITK